MLIKLFYLLSYFVPKDEQLITLIFRGYSGSNLTPIMEELKEGPYCKNYKVNVVNDGLTRVNFIKGKIGRFHLIKHTFYKYWQVFRSRLVITTHGFYRLRGDNFMINLWHGVPLKSMGLMNNSRADAVGTSREDYFLSTSAFFNTVMNACLGIWGYRYFIGGYPRNDYLFNQNGAANLGKLIGKRVAEESKIILYMPTYRDVVQRERMAGNIFGFDDFDFQMFSRFLELNDIVLLVKLHPNEEHLFIETVEAHTCKRIILIKSGLLEKKQMDFYKVMNAVDVLITDYSSVYFDYLLLNRPVMFVPVDLKRYRKHRGLLLEPYNFWTPGPKCTDQDTFQAEINKCLNDSSYFEKERKMIRDIFHEYTDGNSTERIIDLIIQVMEE